MFWILLVAVFSAAQGKPVRICVPEPLSAACQEMATDLPESFSCIVEPDTFGCLKKVSAGDADLVNVDPAALYAGGFFFNLQPLTTELVGGPNAFPVEEKCKCIYENNSIDANFFRFRGKIYP